MFPNFDLSNLKDQSLGSLIAAVIIFIGFIGLLFWLGGQAINSFG